MAAISSAGVGSGIDIRSLVSQLMEAERMPVKLLDKKEAGLQAKISTLGTIKGALSAFGSAAAALSTPAQLSPLKASVADASLFGAAATPDAAPGSYDVEVKQLASTHKLLSGGFASTSTAVGTVGATLTFNFGSYVDDGAGGTDFTATAGKASKTITLDASNNSLSGLRDAINNANMGVTASIINDGSASGYRLALTTTDTGANNALQIVAGDASLEAFSFDAAGGTSQMTQTAAAQDAIIKVDTITITKHSNTITDAIQGVTLNLAKESAPGVSTRLNVNRDTASVKSAMENFVKSYNDLQKVIVDATGYNSAAASGAKLAGDGTVRSIQDQLRSVMTSSIAGASVGASTLADVGIEFQRDGTLALNGERLNDALNDPHVDMTALFAAKDGNKGYGQQLDQLVGQLTSPVGPLANHSKGFSDSIASLSRQRDSINSRLEVTQKRYLAQFAAMDSIVANMNATGNFLAQQISSLAAMNGSGKR